MCVCVSVKTDIKIDNHYNKEFLAGGGGVGVGQGVVNYNCQGRSKNFYKPEVLKVTCTDPWDPQDPFRRSIRSKSFSKY